MPIAQNDACWSYDYRRQLIGNPTIPVSVVTKRSQNVLKAEILRHQYLDKSSAVAEIVDRARANWA